MLRIKLVEVENFKSFSSRISLPLESGLNVINGPNGTGKSNLLDAICCAFGCEPKLLRVNNYSDLLNAQGLHVAQQGYAMLHLQSESTRTVLRVEINSKGAIWSIDGRTQSAKEIRDFGRSHGFDYSEGSMGIIRQNFVVRLLDNPRMLSDAIQGANGALRLLDSIRAAQNEAVRLKEAKGGINSALTLLKARIEEEEKKQKRKIRMMGIQISDNNK
ncbi:MAG: hypothetical protein EZS28_011461 [Streblomastix strix]|uniref:RecF/RecN/SMC N-terminal domain-containing protein n=1 Tax=Streblomastix strix TaxID=222440 RepID=A0A5J4WDP5_9EUKA|nr:MAG: hypothetical protein EZS28_011461 [Streblomastix strix]